MIFEHVDTGQIYIIPEEYCNILEYAVNGKLLKLSTGEIVRFRQCESAEQVWCLLDECFRKGWSRLTFHERAGMAYSMSNN